MSSFNTKHLQVACLVANLFLFQSVQAALINNSADGTTGVGVNKGGSTSTSTPITPTIFGNFPVTPTFGMTGAAYAYEERDEFDVPPEVKVDITNGLTGINVKEKTKTESANASGTYGNNFAYTDYANAEASFVGTPTGLGVNLGVIEKQLVTGISAQMNTTVDTQQSTDIPVFATATVTDPFHFSGLTGDEGLTFFSVLDAGMNFMFDSEGEAVSNELRHTFSSSIEIEGMVDSLFDLIIAVGTTSAGIPDMVVDFTSNALLGIDDGIMMQTILDGFLFNAQTSTSTLASDIVIYDGAIPLPSGVTDFTLAFDTSMTSDSYSLYQHIQGGATTVPEPTTMLLFGTGIAVFAAAGRRRRK